MAKKPLTISNPKIFNPLIFECNDSSEQRINAKRLIQGDYPRDSDALAARLSKQFIEQNRGILNYFDTQISRDYDGNNVWLVFKTGIKIGAAPLFSPTSGKPEYGIVIKPRFEWAGIGGMLAQMGWRIVPNLLKLPLLQGTERKIPTWVISSYILARIHILLDQLDRKFELTQSLQPAPKGTVNWSDYATIRIPSAQFLQILCRYPDLRDDRELKAGIHYVLKKQLAGLESQRNLTNVVRSLIDLCQSLILRVSSTPPRKPSPNLMQTWFTGPFRNDVFRDGIQAIEWTVNDRGLAGLADLQGIPWILPMDQFFEGWLETLVSKLAKMIGGTIKVGRKHETLSPIHWEIPYEGSQKYLLPDIILEKEESTYIFDAKYKRHWEELSTSNWYQIEQDIQEQHRNDLLQVLAYTSLKSAKRVVACLVYPCQTQTWESLKTRGRLYRRATIPSDGRNIEVILTATPMKSDIEISVENLENAIKAEY